MKEKLFCNLRKSWLLILMILPSFLSWGQTPNGTLDFGNPTSGTTASPANTGFSGVRVGSGGGGFTIQNPGQSIGANGELRGIAPTNASINSVGIASTEYGTAASTFTVSFDLHLSGGSSGTWYFFAGNGISFAASQSSAFTGSQIFTGLRWVFGASNAITTNNRNAGNWNATGLSGTPFAQNTAYSVTIIGNNSASLVSYTGGSVASNTYDLWVNGVLVGDNLAKAQLAANSNINAFRFYAESSTSNVAQLALDNVVWYNTCVLPGSSTPTQVATPSIAASGTAVATNTYVDSTNITLSTSTANATIYYTTDGSTPTTSSNQYSTPFAVTTSTTIKAVAVADGLTNSEVATRDITIVNAPNNDACSNAGVLTVNGSAVNGNLQYSSFVSPFNRKDVWYSVTPTYSAIHVITLSGFSGDADLYIFDQSSNCPTTSTDIGSSILDTPEVISVFLTSGVTYYIRVAAWDTAAENTFSIQVTADEPQPSITTNPLTVPQLSSSLGSSDTETIAVNGFLLTENITVALEGADATQFSISEISFTVNSGNASGSLVITYQPTTLQAQHAASVRLSSLGADDVVLTLTGIPSLATPVATAATNVSSSSFTANWNPVSGAESYELDIYRMVASEAPELVVNGGFETGDKSNWTGSNNANYTVQTSSPNSGTYYVSRSQGTGSSILQQDVAVEIGQTYVFSFWYNNYNGSDSNGLKNFTIQGTSGANYIDAGTPKLAAASTWTKYEKTFTATSSNIRISVRAYQLADIDDISLKLASGGTSIQYVPGYEALTVNGTSQQVSGLSPQTEYSYVVRATSGTTTTSNSNEIDVTTLAAPPTFGTVFQSGDLVCDGTNATFFITGLIADSVSNITYTINEVEFTANNVVANASGLAILSIQVFEENNGQNLVITQIERTDATTAPFSPTMNNTVVISVSANQTWYQDTDGDGYGKTDVTLVNCTQP
ncbi:chitobiase/beta-hexosaminidase C-terminal domain-containing protein, partial [Flavobacterium macrobrachii]|uniref:chitobiase/beta-hexosaminidase C-terminal domain-containing protein n=1 Tax=Flavobacterium macrobrachii TaxID=591204 RepID=UPI003F6E60D8